MSLLVHLIVLLPSNHKKRLAGPTKHSIHHRAKFMILSVVLHSDDSPAKIT